MLEELLHNLLQLAKYIERNVEVARKLVSEGRVREAHEEAVRTLDGASRILEEIRVRARGGGEREG